VLSRQPRAAPPVSRIFDGEQESNYSCGWCRAAQGTRALTLRFVGRQSRGSTIVDRASDSTIGRPRKNILPPCARQQWSSAEVQQRVLAAMEACWPLHRGHSDPDGPLVCVTIPQSTPRLDALAIPINPASGPFLLRVTSQRRPPISLCCLPPLEGWRHVKVTDRHIRRRLRSLLKYLPTFLLHRHIVLVPDNLNIHHKLPFMSVSRPRAADWVERVECTTTRQTLPAWLRLASPNSASFRLNSSKTPAPRQQNPHRRMRSLGADRNATQHQGHWHFTTPTARINSTPIPSL